MFDTKIIKTAAPYPQEIHEHRAPTDDSIRILREMEAKARQQVADSFVFTDNSVNGSVTVFHNELTPDRTVYVRLTLNGREHKDKFVVHDAALRLDRRAAEELLFERLSKLITGMLFQQGASKGWRAR